MWHPDVLVIGPGGAKGLYYLGALISLHVYQLLSNIHTYAGVSVGSIFSLLLAANISLYDIIFTAMNTDVLDLHWLTEPMDPNSSISLENVMNIYNHGGFFSTDHIRQKLEDILVLKMGVSPTFSELYERTNKHLVVVAYNMDLQKVQYFNDETAPNMKCLEAVMLSINIPIVFKSVQYQDMTFVDGGVGNPYPVNLFDHSNQKVLGMYIMDYIRPQPTNYFVRLVSGLVDSHIKTLRDTSSENCKHIVINITDGDTLGVNLSNTEKINMICHGFTEGKSFFETLG